MNKINFPPLTGQNEVLTHTLHRIAHALMLRADSELEQVGLSRAKVWAMIQIRYAEEPIGISQLATGMGSGKSNATQLVDRMEAEGLVRRTQNPEDRRSVQLEVTEEGLRRLNNAEAIRGKIIEEIFSPLTQEERDTFQAIMGKLAGSLDLSIDC